MRSFVETVFVELLSFCGVLFTKSGSLSVIIFENKLDRIFANTPRQIQAAVYLNRSVNRGVGGKNDSLN